MLQDNSQVFYCHKMSQEGFRFSFGPYVLDFSQRCLYKNDGRLELSSNQFALLNVLAQHAGKPFSVKRTAQLSDKMER